MCGVFPLLTIGKAVKNSVMIAIVLSMNLTKKNYLILSESLPHLSQPRTDKNFI